MNGMPRRLRLKGPSNERVETAWSLVSIHASKGVMQEPYVLRAAIEAHQCTLARVEILRSGYGGREEGEWTS